MEIIDGFIFSFSHLDLSKPEGYEMEIIDGFMFSFSHLDLSKPEGYKLGLAL